jgi:hypothetical protein
MTHFRMLFLKMLSGFVSCAVGAHFGRQIQPKGGKHHCCRFKQLQHAYHIYLGYSSLGKAVSWGVLAHCVKSGTETGHYTTPSQPKHKCPLTM